MTRPLAFVCLAAALLVPRAGDGAAASLVGALLERPGDTLRDQRVDVNDAWDAARLLARFGERRRAHELLEGLPRDRVTLTVERFDARLLAEMGLYQGADSLLALQPDARDPRSRYLYYLHRSRLNVLASNYSRALDFIGRLPESGDTLFGAYADMVALEALLGAGRYDDACARAESRSARGVPPPMSPKFEQLALDAYLGSRRLERAVDLIESIKKKTAQRSLFAPVLVREVDVRFVLGDTAGAVQAARELVESPGGATVGAAVDTVLSRVPVAQIETGVLLELCDYLLSRGRVGESDTMITVLAGRTMPDPDRERLRLMRSELFYKEKRYGKALREVDNPFEAAALERDAKLLRARLFRATGQRIRSADAYEGFASAYPYDSKAPEALYAAWDLQREGGNAARSQNLLMRIVETYPSHRYARLATLRRALDHTERGEYAEAARIIERALDRRGREDAALLYYLGDAYAKLGKKDRKAQLTSEIAYLNPFSFYLDPEVPAAFVQPSVSSEGNVVLSGEDGLLEFLRMILQAREGAYERLADSVGSWGDPAGAEDLAAGIVRGRCFLQMGFRDWGEAELRAVESSGRLTPRASVELGALYDDFAVTGRSVRTFQRVYYSMDKEKRRVLDGDIKSLVYPTPFPSVVLENCSRYRMSPHLVYAMIREESRFDDKAVSNAGAMGLMQIMPETGEQLAEELGVAGEVHTNLLTPEVNLTFGIWYASRLLEKSNDDPLMLLAAYNAGLSRAKEWFGTNTRKRSVIERVDEIDYWETQEYVKRIVESSHIYHTFYFSSAVGRKEPPPVGGPGNEKKNAH